MKNDGATTKKSQQTQGVVTMQHVALAVAFGEDSELLPGIVSDFVEKLLTYIEKTEIPILAEFCAEIGIDEDFILKFFFIHEKTSVFLRILENKKRAALERKIYSGELNATIGTQLMKKWAEEPKPETQKKYRRLDFEDLDALELQADEQDTIINFMRTLDIKISTDTKIKKLSRSTAEAERRGL